MVEYNPNQRISYSSLIDCLNPLLTSNIEKVQKIYGNTVENQNTMSMVLSGVKSRG